MKLLLPTFLSHRHAHTSTDKSFVSPADHCFYKKQQDFTKTILAFDSQEYTHRALLSIALSLTESLVTQQMRRKRCHIREAAPWTHLLQLAMRKAGRHRTLLNQPKAEHPLLMLSLKAWVFSSLYSSSNFPSFVQMKQIRPCCRPFL